jgi:hypothetical protein
VFRNKEGNESRTCGTRGFAARISADSLREGGQGGRWNFTGRSPAIEIAATTTQSLSAEASRPQRFAVVTDPVSQYTSVKPET